MENIYTVAANVLFFGKLVGFFPLSFNGPPRKGILSTKWHDVTAFCVMIVFISFFMIMNLLNKAYIESSSSMVTNGWNISINIEIISYLLLIGYQMKKRRKFTKLLQHLAAVDAKVFQLFKPEPFL